MTTSVRMVCAAVAALLAACGGGGGGGGDEGCPSGSVISINPPSLRVTAGTAAVSFGGGATNCTADAHWTLTGPGSLDTTSGVPVHYTPPASVDTVTTATLTISMGGLSTSAIISIDPAIVVLSGRVMTVGGFPVANAQVNVGSGSTTADSSGMFTLAGVTPPYDLYVSSANGLLTSVYPGLRRMDPTLMLFDSDDLPTTWIGSGGPLVGYAAGTVSGGAGFPESPGHEAMVAFRSPDATAAGSVNASTGSFVLQGAWWGFSSTTGAIHALQWQVGASDVPVAFDGYATRSGVTLTSPGTLAGQDLALSPVTASTLTGSIGDGLSASLAARAVFTDGGWIRFLPPPSVPSFFGGPGTPSFSIPAPAVPGATIDLVARRDYVDRAYQEVHLHGLAPGASGVTAYFGGLPAPATPPWGAINVGAGTTFTWSTMPDHPVYVVSFRPGVGAPGGSPSYDVFLIGWALTIPADIPLPRGAPYTWRVRGSSAFSTVDEAAGPAGFLAPAAFYRIAQGTSSAFTTAP